jgi:hypothetical protein
MSGAALTLAAGNVLHLGGAVQMVNWVSSLLD